MKSFLTEDFIDCYKKLPRHVRTQARKSYQIWKENPQHPGLQFKKVHRSDPIYSVRVSIGWRAVGIIDADTIVWFWIGCHGDYDKLLASL